MFVTKAIIAVASLFAVATAAPTAELKARTGNVGFTSFNNWGGFTNLATFDNFFGVNNFNGFLNQQVLIQQPQLVCVSLPIQVVQQRLFILQEVMKQIVLQQICEVEVQTIILNQFSAGFNVFNLDLRRVSGRQIGFDSSLTGRFGSIFNTDGTLSTTDLGFSGLDIGKNFVSLNSNWNSATSPSTVGNAQSIALAAAGLNLPQGVVVGSS